MKFINMRNLCGVVAMAAAGGCASETPTHSSGEGSFKLVVSPLELDSRVDYACYAITVKDTDGNEVWSDDELCTTDWSIGNDETLSYVGLCEASGDGMNSVSIELTRLVGDDGEELGNWPDDAPPTYATDFLCTANADAVVNAQSSYWHTLIGINPGWRDCTISARMTASNGDFGANNTYPTIIAHNVPFGFDAEGGFVCVHPLDGDDGGLTTDWDPDVDYDNCLTPDETTPDDVTDVIVEDCEEGDPQGECPVGQSDPDGDGVCTDDDTCTFPYWWWRAHYDGAQPASSDLDWPAPEDESTLLCGMTWIDIMRAPGGRTWYILAHEWISARLNLANGAWAPADVRAVIAASEFTLLANCARVPDDERHPALELSGILHGYNEGAVGPGLCPILD